MENFYITVDDEEVNLDNKGFGHHLIYESGMLAFPAINNPHINIKKLSLKNPPNYVRGLICRSNYLEELEIANSNIQYITCDNNNLTNLTLPLNTRYICCDNVVNLENLNKVMEREKDVQVKMVDKNDQPQPVGMENTWQSF